MNIKDFDSAFLKAMTASCEIPPCLLVEPLQKLGPSKEEAEREEKRLYKFVKELNPFSRSTTR
jgi:hypothetical protein